MSTLKGNRIELSFVEEKDAPALLKLEQSNKDFFQLYSGTKTGRFYTLEAQEERIAGAMKQREQDRGYQMLIRLQAAPEVIGTIALTEVARGNLQSAWLGYMLDRGHNGQGLMTEAVRLLVPYAFGELDLHRLEAGVMPHHEGSIRVLAKAGFQKEGLARKNVRINGRWEDHVTLAIVREEPEELPKSDRA
ncbi:MULTISPECIES: GNAT family protein [unclassified Paenibacillus]|uniref:GNAT family N-acetyltransferase n=1 Tax=unclassified Paenibacillus TaxID=185978 RepID=UPI000955B807|nr:MULTISPECIES: GNAT family protein [unclassified Paenibacillus]ASS67778.1 GNAT family N-acetyltransferase [Paenibacillus sp. RUD330]SIR60949.1 ribosomal-protein-alanine N-acetyltransferase [Paenibacillus sp. RU4X]SIR69645.1 ribosomal-protein-alanine N-acetyltransferase [Paenibacillus sp. RU4T]